MLKIKQLFCKHRYEKYFIPHAYKIVDGWMVQVTEYRCEKCGKKKNRGCKE